MTDRKKPGVAFWATVALVVMLIGYPLSVGPAFWITNRTLLRDSLSWRNACVKLYAPVFMIADTSDTISDAVSWYMRLGLD